MKKVLILLENYFFSPYFYFQFLALFYEETAFQCTDSALYKRLINYAVKGREKEMTNDQRTVKGPMGRNPKRCGGYALGAPNARLSRRQMAMSNKGSKSL
ncbi:MAG: hypothetical protein OXH16_03040 [Gemmatimonadetes bacterium]|nr:hypothetical protein [Gemmatimonadota bacterium]